jgi:transcriptional regulator with GAF, ATPase, and Fis domain
VVLFAIYGNIMKKQKGYKMDESEFFRQATVKICGILEIEEALVSSLNFLRQEMPVDRMLLELFEDDLNAMRTVAMATPGEGMTVDLLTPMTSEARQEMRQFEEEYLQQPNSAWLIQDDPHGQLMFHEMLQIHGSKVTSLLVLPLRLGDKVVGGGGLLLATEGDRKFTRKHADLLYLLREPFAIAMSNALRHREVIKLKDLLADDKRQLQRELLHISGDEIVGADFGLRNVMQKVRQVAPTESPVLLTGETGVGKDVVANAIHLGSSRRDGPFIPVNCGAIPESLLDSELFGHEKGAFTGALSRKRGRFERADKGTIFLDEIGEMPLDAQVRLLRVIQHREIERIGGTDRIPVDIRIIAATNQNPEAMVQAGRFREDLWFRLNVFPIAVPPLRDRTSDIPALVQHFIERKARELKIADRPQLAPGAIDDLMTYHWPGNVRELENLVERAMILHREEPLRFDDIGTSSSRKVAATTPATDEESLDLDSVIARHIRLVLGMTDGKVHGPGGAAELLRVNASTLRYRMEKLRIDYGRKSKS